VVGAGTCLVLGLLILRTGRSRSLQPVAA
jgi:hypothetical protein